MERNWTEIFEWFHQNPELPYKEFETTKKIREILEEEQIEIIESGLETGLIAVIRGGKEGKIIALRADIDALPIYEESGLAYASVNKGVMHACGHDFHAVATLAAAIRLNRQKNELNGTIYVIFQPGEEAFGGAESVVDTGLIDDVQEFYCIHTEPAFDAGCVGVTPKGVRAAGDRFRVDIKGVGTHGAAPHLGDDPIEIMTQMIGTLRALADRKVDPLEPRVISFTRVSGGSAWNIIPTHVFFEGTVRTLSKESRKTIKDNFAAVTESFNKLAGAECALTWTDGPEAVINDIRLCEIAREAAKRAGLPLPYSPPTMASDDYSAFLSSGKPGVYVRFGVGKGHGLHHPQYCVDEEAIAPAIDYMEALALTALEYEG